MYVHMYVCMYRKKCSMHVYRVQNYPRFQASTGSLRKYPPWIRGDNCKQMLTEHPVCPASPLPHSAALPPDLCLPSRRKHCIPTVENPQIPLLLTQGPGKPPGKAWGNEVRRPVRGQEVSGWNSCSWARVCPQPQGCGQASCPAWASMQPGINRNLGARLLDSDLCSSIFYTRRVTPNMWFNLFLPQLPCL